MIQKYNTYRILQLFFDFPTKCFQMREISRLIKLSMPSVKIHIERLEKEKLIKKQKNGVYDGYIANKNDLFKVYKRNNILLRLHESGLIDFLVNSFSPDTIVLFGSASRGEDIETSDIDLLVISSEENIDLRKFEKKLKRKISLHFEPNISKLPKELLNNIINGITVYGYLEVFE